MAREEAAFADILGMALRSLGQRPLRAVLTVLGFTLSMAIAAVLIATGEGLEKSVASILRTLGEGQVVATPGRTTGVGGVRRSGRTIQIRYEDAADLSEALPSFSGVAPFFDLRGGGAASYRFSIPFSPVRAVGRGYLDVRGTDLVDGRWFNEEEEEEGRWVTVLNEGLRKMIFHDEPAVGRWVEWRGRRLDVVGVVRDDALFPYILFIPYETVKQLSDSRTITGLVARPRPGVDWSRAIAELRRVIAGLGGFDAGDENAIEIEDNSEFTRRVAVLSAALRVLVWTIAGVSLLLGGLGVANMMAIGVAERTREFGLRKAIGATREAIFAQVLVEALVVLFTGGLLGGAVGAAAVSALPDLQISSTYLAEVRFDLVSALFCAAGLGLVGTLAALIPARRAAALPAAEALRWE
jgi:putative ABC transport system permease protein